MRYGSMNETQTIQELSMRAYFDLAFRKEQGVVSAMHILRDHGYDLTWYNELTDKLEFFQNVRTIKESLHS